LWNSKVGENPLWEGPPDGLKRAGATFAGTINTRGGKMWKNPTRGKVCKNHGKILSFFGFSIFSLYRVFGSVGWVYYRVHRENAKIHGF